MPSNVTIDVGGTVTWINSDAALHNMASGTIQDDEIGTLFGATDLLMKPGDEYSFTFTDFEPGEYPYFCFLHPHMSGTITVVAAGEDGDAMDDGMMMDEPSAMYALSDGTAIKLYSGEPTEGEQLEITVLFVDSEHVNYDLMVTQGDDTVLEDIAAHEHQGMGTHTTAPLASSDPVDVTITFQGFGVTEPFTGDNIGEEAVFTGVVPEFGTIAMIILGVAVMSIVAVTARSRIVPRI